MGQGWVLFGDRWRSKGGFGAFADFLDFHVCGGLDADVVAAFHFNDDGCAFADRAGNQDALVDFAFAGNSYDVADVAVGLF